MRRLVGKSPLGHRVMSLVMGYDMSRVRIG
jgi:hypothetical protein